MIQKQKKSKSILCDIDGTISHTVSRGPFDWMEVDV